MRRSWLTPLNVALAVLALVAALLSGCAGRMPEGNAATKEAIPVSDGGGGTAGGRPVTRVPAPPLRVEVVASGLDHPWDIGFLPDGQLLVTERSGRLLLLSSGAPGASVRPVAADFTDVWARGEGGLMGLALHPDFATSRRFVTCQTHAENGRAVDVRLITWELSADGGTARRVQDPLVGGMPVNPSGRHSGCRPTVAPDGTLLVGTGDTARGAVSQDRTSLGGKVLRVDLATGGPAPGNPFAGSANPNERLLLSYGHRNVQGVTFRPGTGEPFVTEHGPDVDDEVNAVRPGGNYGWDPSQGGTVGGYDEDVPMTDQRRFPDAIPARWSSGPDTEAISGSAFLTGPLWGALDGALAVPALRGEKLLLMTLGEDGLVRQVSVPAELDGRYGRLRTARLSPAGELYLTSDNGVSGGSSDVVLRVRPG